MNEQSLAENVYDLLADASWAERLPASYESGDDPELLEIVAEIGMPTEDPIDTLKQAVTLITADIERIVADRRKNGGRRTPAPSTAADAAGEQS